jgi:hypothetical protein
MAMSWSSVRFRAWESCTENRSRMIMSRPNSCSVARSGLRNRFPRFPFVTPPPLVKE